MARKNEELQNLIQLYKFETGHKTVDMDDVAEWAIKKGVIAPKPKSPKELLSAQFAQAAREEHNRDPETGWSYRVNHALRMSKSDGTHMGTYRRYDSTTNAPLSYQSTTANDWRWCTAKN